MAILEEQFTESESLDAGATPIKYEGDVERQREIAQKLWAQLNPQQQMEFGTFEQFFSSGAWKKVLEMIMQQQRGEGQDIMEGEGTEVMEQGMGMQAPPLPPTPSPMVNPGAGAAAPGPAGGMGQRPMMPQPRPAMARGGIAELFEEEEIEEPGFDEIEEEEEVIGGPKGKFRRMLERAAMRSLKGPKDPSALTAGMMSRMRGTRNIMEPMGGAVPMGGTWSGDAIPQRRGGELPPALAQAVMNRDAPAGQIRTGTGGAPVMRPRQISHDPGDASSEAWFNLWKEHPMGHMFPSLDKFISWYLDTTDYDPDRMADGGRIGFGLGSFVKKAFKKAKRAVKKVAKSPIGKAAIMYGLTAGLGSLGAGSARAGSGMFGWLNPSNVAANLGTSWSRFGTSKLGESLLGKADPIGTGRMGGLLSKFPGGMGGAALAASMAAPFIFPNLGKPKEVEDLRSQSPDIDLGDIRGRVQAAYQEGPDAVAALQQEFPYLLPYGSANRAEGGRIGYQDAGPVESSETSFEAQTGLGGEDPAFSQQVNDEIQRRQAEYEWDGQGDYQLALDKIALQTKAEMWGKKKLGQAQGGRIGYGLGSWLKSKVGLGRREGRAEAAPGRTAVAQDPDVMRSKLYNYFANKMGGRGFKHDFREQWTQPFIQAAHGGRIGAQEGGLMDLGGMEKDYRQEGGFVPLGGEEKADDVPARLSKNEFVFTADAVRAAGGGDIDQGAEVMENVMENLEQGGQISEESQGLEGARDMFATSERLSEVV